jgi:hypothetical protein
MKGFGGWSDSMGCGRERAVEGIGVDRSCGLCSEAEVFTSGVLIRPLAFSNPLTCSIRYLLNHPSSALFP